jgi:hypothetical protein
VGLRGWVLGHELIGSLEPGSPVGRVVCSFTVVSIFFSFVLGQDGFLIAGSLIRIMTFPLFVCLWELDVHKNGVKV